MGYDGSLKFNTKIDESGFNSGIGKLGTIAKGGLAVLGAAVAGFAAVTKSAVDEVASLEQNIGGVETLFKKSADIVIKNAERAYETAGMSANEYMSTVTSFSASLLQSLGGDTEKAAKVADMAITDMSDNANKMGTSIEMIQNAYQGFAKQNYTMLDNLKLGYGGTKTEMERLLADAEKISGIKYDISNLNDVYQAIHVIQTELGITGTTAKEAASTIEGSMSSAKAAWENFLAGVGTADDLAEAFGTAAKVLSKNLAQIVPRLVSTIPAAVDGMVEGLSEAVGEANLASVGLSILEDITSGIMEGAPVAIASGAQMLAGFLTGISEKLPELINQGLQLIVVLADAIISNLPVIVDAGLKCLTGLVRGIINSLPLLITEGPRIINQFCDALWAAVGKIISTGAKLIVELGKGLISSIPTIIANAGQILLAIINVMSLSKMLSLGKSLITNMANGVKSMSGSISTAGKTILKNLVAGIKSLATSPVSAIKSIGTKAMSAFKGLNWASIGKNIISGIARGITGGASAIISAAKGAARNALNSAKKALGIHSPSRVFRDEVGKMMAEGMGIGFEKNVPVDDMSGALDTSVQQMQKRVSTVTQTAGTDTSSAINKMNVTGAGAKEPDNVNVTIENHFEVDGTKLVDKTTKATIKKINGAQKNTNKAKGK